MTNKLNTWLETNIKSGRAIWDGVGDIYWTCGCLVLFTGCCTKPSIYTGQVCTLHVITLLIAVDTWRRCAKYLQTHAEYPLFSKNTIVVDTWCNFAHTWLGVHTWQAVHTFPVINGSHLIMRIWNGCLTPPAASLTVQRLSVTFILLKQASRRS